MMSQWVKADITLSQNVYWLQRCSVGKALAMEAIEPEFKSQNPVQGGRTDCTEADLHKHTLAGNPYTTYIHTYNSKTYFLKHLPT